MQTDILVQTMSCEGDDSETTGSAISDLRRRYQSTQGICTLDGERLEEVLMHEKSGVISTVHGDVDVRRSSGHLKPHARRLSCLMDNRTTHIIKTHAQVMRRNRSADFWSEIPESAGNNSESISKNTSDSFKERLLNSSLLTDTIDNKRWQFQSMHQARTIDGDDLEEVLMQPDQKDDSSSSISATKLISEPSDSTESCDTFDDEGHLVDPLNEIEIIEPLNVQPDETDKKINEFLNKQQDTVSNDTSKFTLIERGPNEVVQDDEKGSDYSDSDPEKTDRQIDMYYRQTFGRSSVAIIAKTGKNRVEGGPAAECPVTLGVDPKSNFAVSKMTRSDIADGKLRDTQEPFLVISRKDKKVSYKPSDIYQVSRMSSN